MNLQLGRATSIVLQTTPYLVYRAIIYGALCMAGLVYVAILAGLGAIFGSGAFVVLLVISLAGAGFFGLGRFLGEYVLYLLRAGHVALITEIVTEGKLPEGVSQTVWAKERVMQYFKETSVLALVDQLVKGIIRAVNRTLFNVMTILPIPGTEGAAKLAQRVVDFSLTYIDESVLAYTFKTKNDNVFDAAKTAIILYCQSWKGILKNAVALALLSYAFVVVAVIIFLIPLGAIAWALPASWGTVKFVLFIVALFLGLSLKWVLFDPIACTSTILTFLHESEGQAADPEWEAKLDKVSDKFRELKDKAAEKLAGAAAKGAEPAVEEPEAG